jgi:GNAT superfamily N-acetyltransferase
VARGEGEHSVTIIEPMSSVRSGAAGELFASEVPRRAEEVPRWDQGEPWPNTQRWVALDEARSVVGYAALWRVRADRFRMDLVVAPPARGRGVGSRLLGQLVGEARSAGAATLQARAEDSDERALEFLTHRGFQETMRMFRQELRTAGAVLEPNERERAALANVELTTLAEEMSRGAEWFERLRVVYEGVREGWRDPDPRPEEPSHRVTPTELQRALDAFPMEPDAFLLAMRDGRYVAFVGSIGTGVLPSFRGRGLATALKRRYAALMRSRGVEVLHTLTGNPAMLRANENVGYRTVSAEVRLVRQL